MRSACQRRRCLVVPAAAVPVPARPWLAATATLHHHHPPPCRLSLAITVPLAVAVYDLIVFGQLPVSNKLSFVSALGLIGFLFSMVSQHVDCSMPGPRPSRSATPTPQASRQQGVCLQPATQLGAAGRVKRGQTPAHPTTLQAALLENALAIQLYYYKDSTYFRGFSLIYATILAYREQHVWVEVLQVRLGGNQGKGCGRCTPGGMPRGLPRRQQPGVGSCERVCWQPVAAAQARTPQPCWSVCLLCRWWMSCAGCCVPGSLQNSSSRPSSTEPWQVPTPLPQHLPLAGFAAAGPLCLLACLLLDPSSAFIMRPHSQPDAPACRRQFAHRPQPRLQHAQQACQRQCHQSGI